MQMYATGLNDLQQELLKIYSVDIDAQELGEIRDILANYFANRAIKEADKAWEDKGYDNDSIKRLLNDEKQ